MFRKNLNIDEMSSQEMEALLSRVAKRLLWLNALWLLFVFAVLFWNTAIGVILLIITVAKYFFDYHDVEAQSHYHSFVDRMIKKTFTRTKDN